MRYSLTQIISAARSDDIEGWMKILTVVILAVFWALGGIIKARTQKSKEGEEQLAERPGQRHPPTAASLQKEKPQQPKHARPAGSGSVPSRQYRRQVEQLLRKIGRPRPVSPSIATEKKPMTIPAVKAPGEPKLPRLVPEVKPAMEELPEVISKPVETLEATVATEALLDYTDPDELRRAILHYEILGRPLSLRGPGEHIIGL
jgi:hypothetical protein